MNFLSLANLLKTSFYTYSWHQSIIKKAFGMLKVSLFHVMQLKNHKIEIVLYMGYGSNQEISLF